METGRNREEQRLNEITSTSCGQLSHYNPLTSRLTGWSVLATQRNFPIKSTEKPNKKKVNSIRGLKNYCFYISFGSFPIFCHGNTLISNYVTCYIESSTTVHCNHSYCQSIKLLLGEDGRSKQAKNPKRDFNFLITLDDSGGKKPNPSDNNRIIMKHVLVVRGCYTCLPF